MLYLVIVFVIFVVEYYLKSYTDTHCLEQTRKEYFGGKLIIRNYHNSEGGFAIFKRAPGLGVKVSGIVLICVFWELFKAIFLGASILVKLGLSLLAGGGWSNYYDRITKGYVTDYVSFGVKNKKLKNMVFNLSDFFIFAGAVVLAFGQLFRYRQKNI